MSVRRAAMLVSPEQATESYVDMVDTADALLDRLSETERDILLRLVAIRTPTLCGRATRLFDHQRQGESTVQFERRANDALALCADCPVLVQCDIQARLLGITGVIGGRYRPLGSTRATPSALNTVAPDPVKTAALVATAQAVTGRRDNPLSPHRATSSSASEETLERQDEVCLARHCHQLDPR